MNYKKILYESFSHIYQKKALIGTTQALVWIITYFEKKMPRKILSRKFTELLLPFTQVRQSIAFEIKEHFFELKNIENFQQQKFTK